MRSEVSKDNGKPLPDEPSTEKGVSVYELLKGKLKFTNEPQWVRIVLYLITALFFIGAVWLLKGSAIFAFLTRKASEKWHEVRRLFNRNLQ